jgi:peptide-methionine (R)-S-oxide reductase
MDTKVDTKHYPVTHTDAEWRKLLTPEQYRVMRGHGTEAPGSCALNYEKRAGTFSCAGCEQPHVFEDGPPPTHLRYCINGVAMDFKPE